MPGRSYTEFGRRYHGRIRQVVLIGILIVLLLIALMRVQPSAEGRRVLVVLAHDGRPAVSPSLVIPSPDGPWTVLPEHFATPIVITDELLGQEAFVTAAGCGVDLIEIRKSGPITLPPPIRITIGVPGTHALPTGAYGIGLRFHAQGVRLELAAALDRAPASPYYRDLPSSAQRVIWLDPTARSAEVLLPRVGRWRVVWTHTQRSMRSISIGFGTGDAVLDVAAGGERHTLAIAPDDIGENWD